MGPEPESDQYGAERGASAQRADRLKRQQHYRPGQGKRAAEDTVSTAHQ